MSTLDDDIPGSGESDADWEEPDDDDLDWGDDDEADESDPGDD